MCWDKIEYIKRGEPYGTVEFVSKTEEAALKVAKETVENKKRLIFPNYLGRVERTIKIGAIPPAIKLVRILAAVLKHIEGYTIFSVTVTDRVMD